MLKEKKAGNPIFKPVAGPPLDAGSTKEIEISNKA